MGQTIKTPKMTLTESILIGMLKENTGAHMLDSGGAYGRNWERNQFRDFMSEPECTLSFKYGIEVTLNVFHWLKERVTYNPMLQSQFTRFAHSKAMEDECWLTCMEAFAERKARKAGYKPNDEGWPFCENTYNHGSLLSQVIQYVQWVDDDGMHVALQIHGGCDVRGGYTAAKIFDANDWYPLSDDARATIICPTCHARWWTDDAYHWYPEPDGIVFPDSESIPGQLSLGITLQKVEQPFDLLSLCEVLWRNELAYPRQEVEEFPNNPERGILYVDREGRGLCPYCSKGVLEARPY